MSAVPRVVEHASPFSFVRRLTLYHVGAAAVFCGILAVAVLPRFDTDIWWHLFVGRYILQHTAVPTGDFLSFTVPLHQWVDHEWLTEVIMYSAYKLGGLGLVVSIFGMVTTGAFLTLFVLMRLRGVNQILALGFTLIAATATVGTWGPRVQMISLLFAALFCYALERYRTTAGASWLVGLVAGSWLWSNLHGGFVIGWILIGVYVLGGAFDGRQGGMSWRQILRWQRPLVLSLIASVMISLVNPNTYHQLLYPLRFITPNAFTNAIQESQSPNFHLFQQLPFEVLVLGLIGFGLRARRRISWIDVLLCVTFTHLALQQTRNIALWCIVVVPIVAVHVQAASEPLLERFQQINRPIRSAFAPTINWLFLVVVLVAGIVGVTRAGSPADVLAAQQQAFPAWGIAYLDHHPMKGNLFNSYSYGGYLIWKTDRRYRVFIDSRADTVYPNSTLSDYLTIYNAAPGWNDLLRRYRIRWLFVEPQAPIVAVLTQRKQWQVDWHGRLAEIIAKRD